MYTSEFDHMKFIESSRLIQASPRLDGLLVVEAVRKRKRDYQRDSDTDRQEEACHDAMAILWMPHNGPAFSGVRRPAEQRPYTPRVRATLPRRMSAQREHVRCNGMLAGGRAILAEQPQRIQEASCSVMALRNMRSKTNPKAFLQLRETCGA